MPFLIWFHFSVLTKPYIHSSVKPHILHKTLPATSGLLDLTANNTSRRSNQSTSFKSITISKFSSNVTIRSPGSIRFSYSICDFSHTHYDSKSQKWPQNLGRRCDNLMTHATFRLAVAFIAPIEAAPIVNHFCLALLFISKLKIAYCSIAFRLALLCGACRTSRRVEQKRKKCVRFFMRFTPLQTHICSGPKEDGRRRQ